MRNIISFFEQLLGLPDTVILSVECTEAPPTVILRMQSTREFIPCQHCNNATDIQGEQEPLVFKHFPIFNKPCLLEIAPRFGICQQCPENPVTIESLPWYQADKSLTPAFKQYLLSRFGGGMQAAPAEITLGEMQRTLIDFVNNTVTPLDN